MHIQCNFQYCVHKKTHGNITRDFKAYEHGLKVINIFKHLGSMGEYFSKYFFKRNV